MNEYTQYIIIITVEYYSMKRKWFMSYKNTQTITVIKLITDMFVVDSERLG